MASTELTCRIRVKKVEDNDGDGDKPQEATFLPLGEYSDVGTEIRVRWANEVMKHFEQSEKPHTSIRPWDFVAELDGSVQSLPMPGVEGDLIEGYPTHFQIPPSTLHSLNHGEKVKRAEMFAMASLLYEIMTGRKPLEGLTDDAVRHRFMNGEFPDDAAALPNTLFIFSGWSAEFSHELTRRGTVYLFVDVSQALLTLHSGSTRGHSFRTVEKLCQSPSSTHRSSSSRHYGFCFVILCGAYTRSCRLHCRGTSSRFCCRSLASVDGGGQSWQPFLLVSECGDGWMGCGRYPSCWCCWNGACKSGRSAGFDGDIQEGFPRAKAARVERVCINYCDASVSSTSYAICVLYWSQSCITLKHS